MRLWLVSLGLLAGCERELSLGTLLVDADGGGAGPATFSCEQRGPLHPVGDQPESACTGEPSAGFHYALCSCEIMQSSQPIAVDGFDSRSAPYTPGAASGSLGVNGALYVTSAQLGGSLIVAGSEGTPLGGGLTIGGQLANGGALQGPFPVSVGLDARIGGDLRVQRFDVGGTLTLAEGAALEAAAGAPAALRAPVAITPPCRCNADLDLAALIARAVTDNENAAIALDPQSSLRTFSTPLTMTLPCGRYFVDDIYANQPIRLVAQGRVALYVRNRVVIDPTGALTIELEGDAELDLFVGQGMSALGEVRIGAPSAPTRTRLHFGASDSIYFGARAVLAASFYAPQAELVTSQPFELYGAALVRRASSSAPLSLHYDRALARDACAAATCQSATDCISPLRCDGARCLP